MKSNKTKKAFKALLNEKFGVCNHTQVAGKRAYKANKRAYGDYLYSQDRGYFDAAYAEWLEGREF